MNYHYFLQGFLCFLKGYGFDSLAAPNVEIYDRVVIVYKHLAHQVVNYRFLKVFIIHIAFYQFRDKRHQVFFCQPVSPLQFQLRFL